MLANQSSLKNSPDQHLCGPGEFFIITTRVYGITLQKTGDNAKYGHAAGKQTMQGKEKTTMGGKE